MKNVVKHEIGHRPDLTDSLWLADNNSKVLPQGMCSITLPNNINPLQVPQDVGNNGLIKNIED